MTDDIVDEYEEIIERVANAAVAHNIVNAIIRSPFTRFFTPHFRFRLIEQDPDDNKFVDCAIVAGEGRDDCFPIPLKMKNEENEETTFGVSQ